jgi:hypothetical protein
MTDRWLPGQTRQFGRAAIGHDRPNPLLRSDLVMDHAADAQKAEKDGVYVVNVDGIESHMRFKKGAVLPVGATFRDEGEEIVSPLQEQQERIAEDTAKRAKGAAPENRAKSAAPESK